MTYRPGDLTFIKAGVQKQLKAAIEARDEDLVDDIRWDNCIPYEARHGDSVAWLPHRCDEWIIGSIDDLRALIKDAQAAIEELTRE